MKARRPGRARRNDLMHRAVQRLRLDRIADGALKPLYPHEHYFLWTLQARRRARYVDFILPGLLFAAEVEIAGNAGAEAEAAADVTAS